MLQSIHEKTIALLLAGLMVLATVTTATATELHQAAGRGDIAAIERLLINGAKVNARDDSGYTALHYAADFGHTEAITTLLKAGADPNARNEWGATALHGGATINGQIDIIKALLDAGAAGNLPNK